MSEFKVSPAAPDAIEKAVEYAEQLGVFRTFHRVRKWFAPGLKDLPTTIRTLRDATVLVVMWAIISGVTIAAAAVVGFFSNLHLPF